MTSKEAKTHIIDTLNGDMNKEYFINELLPEILKDLERLEEIEKAQDLEIGNLKFIDNENKYQVAIRVLKEAFIVLGKSDITNTCWFKYLEELEKENQILKKALDKACEMLEWGCPVEQDLIDDLDCENCKNTEKECWKKYFLKEVLENEKD